MNHEFIFSLAFVLLLLLINIIKGQDPPSQDEKELYDKYKAEVCTRVPEFTGSADPGPEWTDEISEDEILELCFVNLAYRLNSDTISHLKPELGWKKNVIDLLSLITKNTCKDDVISEPYLNAAKNLFLYYLSKRPSSPRRQNATDAEIRMAEWVEISEALSICANSITPIDITTQCGIATSFEGKNGSAQQIKETVERFDQEIAEEMDVTLDIIIDTAWWMFSAAYSRCYAYFYPNEDVILLFFQMFREDFLEQFLGRWRNAGPNTIHFPIVFGPYDYKTSSDNVRKCATAAFQYEGLSVRQLVRPVTVLVDNTAVRNFKVKG